MLYFVKLYKSFAEKKKGLSKILLIQYKLGYLVVLDMPSHYRTQLIAMLNVFTQ